MKTYLTVLAVILLTATSLIAQTNDRPFLSPTLDNIGLLNPNNLQINHSVSFMSGASSSGKGFYQSVYTNHLLYQFSPNLDLKIDLNFVNHGSVNWERDFSVNSNNDNASMVVPEFSLNYRPTKNSLIIIEYRQSVNPYSATNWRW